MSTALLEGAEIFHTERAIENISTSETRKACPWIRECICDRCVGTHVHSLAEQRRMFLPVVIG